MNRIVVMFLDFAEDQARRRKQLFLKDWHARLDDFPRFNDRGVLRDAGRVTRQAADEKAVQEYEQFAAGRRALIEAEAESDTLKQLEQAVKRLPKRKPARL